MKHLFFTFIGLIVSVLTFSQQEIVFDSVHVENVYFLGEKSTIDVKQDPTSANHFYAFCFSEEEGDSLKYRFYTEMKSIKTRDLEKLQKGKKIIVDGFRSYYGKSSGESSTISYKMGKREGITRIYKKGILFSESNYEDGIMEKKDIFYPDGSLWTSIISGPRQKVKIGDREVSQRTEYITEYYEPGNIKRREFLFTKGKIISQKHYTPEGKDTIFMYPFQRPASFPGGKSAFNSYVMKNKKYPPEDMKKEITGYVGVSFYVNKDGSIGTVKAAKPLSSATDAEAVRLVKNMPVWEPAIFCGNPVGSWERTMITFDPHKNSTSSNSSSSNNSTWGDW